MLLLYNFRINDYLYNLTWKQVERSFIFIAESICYIFLIYFKMLYLYKTRNHFIILIPPIKVLIKLSASEVVKKSKLRLVVLD